MKPLKPRDKVTQHMTRDGLTLDNQTTGESISISSREAEQDYSAAEPGGTAEKVLERAGDIRERSKAKRAAKDGANTAAQATGPASRLQFTAEERGDPALSMYVYKAGYRADKRDASKEARGSFTNLRTHETDAKLVCLHMLYNKKRLNKKNTSPS